MPEKRKHIWDGPAVGIGPALISTCSVCGLDERDQGECPGENEAAKRALERRIFNTAEKALAIVREAPPTERLGVIAAMQALQISTEVKSGQQLEEAMAYVSTTVHTLLPEIRQAAKAMRRKRSN